jgi:hypothetical protein
MSTNKEACQKWLMCSKFWSCYNETQGDPDKTNRIQVNQVFANRSEEDEMYPVTVKEIVKAQKADSKLKHFFKSNAVPDKGLELKLIENKSCICHKGRLVIPKPLQGCAVMWYHHYLQHPGHTHLEETMKAVIY